MQIRNQDWKATDHLSLSTQTSATAEAVQASAMDKALFWAPAKARSCTIGPMEHTDYYYQPTGGVVTGYASFAVYYYTTTNEGSTRLPEKKKKA
jgi:hypothetical protein